MFTFSFYQESDFDELLELALRAYAWETPACGLSRVLFSHGLHPAFTGHVRAWEHTMGLYREDGRLIACVFNEGTYEGDSFFLFDSPERVNDMALLHDMIRFAKTHNNRKLEDGHTLRASVFAAESNAALRDALLKAGFVKGDYQEQLNVLPFTGQMFDVRLPEGYAFRSGWDVPDFYLSNVHRFAFGYGSGDTACDHGEQAFHELRQSPRYRPEWNLCVVDPMDRPVAMCMLWYDPRMPYCELEPLGVAWWERRKGIATAILHEAANRVLSAYPACGGMLGGDQPFYTRIGFETRAVVPVYEWKNTVYISWEKESLTRHYADEL